MAARMVVELENGKKIYFGDAPDTGLSEVSLGEDVTRATAAAFDEGLTTLASLFDRLDEAMKSAKARPDKVELAFKASLRGKCDLWIVSGDGTAEFAVTATWGK